eukprot:8281457-Pyramimonas_sp.AAC.1
MFKIPRSLAPCGVLSGVLTEVRDFHPCIATQALSRLLGVLDSAHVQGGAKVAAAGILVQVADHRLGQDPAGGTPRPLRLGLDTGYQALVKPLHHWRI